MAATLTACGNSNSTTTTEPTTQPTTTVPETTQQPTAEDATTKVSEKTTTIAETPSESEDEYATGTSTTFKESTTTTNTQKATSPKPSSNNISFNKDIQGRGMSDAGRDEPEYTQLYGYAAIYDVGYEQQENGDCMNTPWKVDTYKKVDADHYEKSGTLKHKSIVKVLSQTLKHEGYGAYSGYLTVQSIENNKKYIIDVNDFVTNDYWNFDSILDSTQYGNVIAKYRKTSKYLPVNRNGEIIKLKKGTEVLIIGKTGTFRGVDRNTRQIEARYYTDKGSSTVYINEDDLKIVY